MNALNINLDLFLENLVFFLCATSCLVIVGWGWKDAKPYSIPEPLPQWFKIWFITVQILGVLLPLVIMIFSVVLWDYTGLFTVLLSYFLMLGLQILSESIALKQFHHVVWVMIPYLYVPYRLWQIYEGLQLLDSATQVWWIPNLLILEICLWSGNYLINLSQLPRLWRWQITEKADINLK
jgi:hypothetical protein